MRRVTPISTRTDTLFPYTTRFRSQLRARRAVARRPRLPSRGRLGSGRARHRAYARRGPAPGLLGAAAGGAGGSGCARRSEEHTSELQSLMRISYAVFCLTKKTNQLHKYITSYNTTQTTH